MYIVLAGLLKLIDWLGLHYLHVQKEPSKYQRPLSIVDVVRT